MASPSIAGHGPAMAGNCRPRNGQASPAWFDDQATATASHIPGHGSWIGWPSMAITSQAMAGHGQRHRRPGPTKADHAQLWMVMANYGQPWPTMAGRGRPCLGTAGHSQPWPSMTGHGGPWPSMADHGLLASIMTGHGRPWPAMAGHGRPVPAIASNFGRGQRDRNARHIKKIENATWENEANAIFSEI